MAEIQPQPTSGQEDPLEELATEVEVEQRHHIHDHDRKPAMAVVRCRRCGKEVPMAAVRPAGGIFAGFLCSNCY